MKNKVEVIKCKNVYTHKKFIVEYNLSIKILEEYNNIISELRIILAEQNGYIYNYKKEEKHKPRNKYNKNYIDIETYLGKKKYKDASFTLSSKSMSEFLNDILQTAERRNNLIKLSTQEFIKALIDRFNYGYDELMPIKLRHNLKKYERQNYQKSRYFSNNNHDVVYLIKTENPHFYINTKTKTMCDTIMVYCNYKTKIFNISFELDEINPYNIEILNVNVFDNKNYNLIKSMCSHDDV
jgi:hypothetical protein